ncbi:MAG: undecaprenyldiphospho-muramoylpentapeptide beta-N-acetylglucosaminyltransferase [Chloroflexota bacterium]|nr:undecaprenyldiphospho-muramoylpentapeptide beta-N-acetylglucosaminyltransferase [Chloroflexota bacterium]
MRLLICAGGTGGGVYPALTVLEALDLDPDSVLWVGSRDGMEETLVTRRDIPYQAIPAAGVHGVDLKRLPGNIWKLTRGFFASRRILREFNPDVLLFTGGYVAFPMAVAGLARESLLFVPDIEPGLALKALARFADKIALTTDTSGAYFNNPDKLTVTGYPTRPGLTKWKKTEALDYFGFDPDLPTLTVTGGSKGARSINNALIKILPQMLDEIQIIHLTGHLDWETVEANSKTLSPSQAKNYQAFPYLHEMGAALAAADLIVSRAGASTLGEYPLFGLPAILVPYPFAWRYQKVNAGFLADHGAAILLRDEDLAEQLEEKVLDLLHDPKTLTSMSRAMRSLATPDAAFRIAGIIDEMASSTRKDGKND